MTKNKIPEYYKRTGVDPRELDLSRRMNGQDVKIEIRSVNREEEWIVCCISRKDRKPTIDELQEIKADLFGSSVAAAVQVQHRIKESQVLLHLRRGDVEN